MAWIACRRAAATLDRLRLKSSTGRPALLDHAEQNPGALRCGRRLREGDGEVLVPIECARPALLYSPRKDWASGGNMEIVWLGHSSVRLRSGNATLITDPYADTVGFSMGNPRADIVTCSNDHPHHSNHEAVEGDPRVVDGPGEYEIGRFYLTGTGTPLGSDEGARRVNTVFTILAEGLTLCHLGDLSQALTPRQVEELTRVDILFVPSGGVCTISVAAAAELVNLVGPRIVVPLHYRVDGLAVELDPLEGFISEMGVTDVAPVPRLNVTASNLPREQRVVVLQREASP